MFDFASYHRAATLADAINLLADNPQAKLLAGGTDVLIQLHHHNDRYRHIVDIHNLAELRGITLAEDGAHLVFPGIRFQHMYARAQLRQDFTVGDLRHGVVRMLDGQPHGGNQKGDQDDDVLRHLRPRDGAHAAEK